MTIGVHVRTWSRLTVSPTVMGALRAWPGYVARSANVTLLTVVSPRSWWLPASRHQRRRPRTSPRSPSRWARNPQAQELPLIDPRARRRARRGTGRARQFRYRTWWRWVSRQRGLRDYVADGLNADPPTSLSPYGIPVQPIPQAARRRAPKLGHARVSLRVSLRPRHSPSLDNTTMQPASLSEIISPPRWL